MYKGGYFISLEGLDTCGKTIQLKLLDSYLKEQGYNVLVTREPGGTPVGERIRDVLLDKKGLNMDPVTELMLFNASRRELVRHVLFPHLLADPKNIAMTDRFIDSTDAYQRFGRGIHSTDVGAVLQVALRYPDERDSFLEPDLTILLDISVEESYRRREKEIADRIEKSGTEFFQKVRDGYLRLANTQRHRIVLINGERSIETIHEEIKGIVTKKLEQHLKQN